MNLTEFQIPHGRFNDTITRHIRALLVLVNDPDAFSVFVMAKCPTRPGAMKDKTVTRYKGQVSLDWLARKQMLRPNWLTSVMKTWMLAEKAVNLCRRVTSSWELLGRSKVVTSL